MFWPNVAIHDYTQPSWGHDFTINQVIQDGQALVMSGWGLGLQVGDYLILPDEENPKRTTRYQIRAIEYRRDPRDMWNATVDFAPRQPEIVLDTLLSSTT